MERRTGDSGGRKTAAMMEIRRKSKVGSKSSSAALVTGQLAAAV